MRIVFDYQIFVLQQEGGISRCFLELAQRLPQLFDDVETAVVAPYFVSPLLAKAGEGNRVKVIGRKVPSFSGKHRVLPVLNRYASRADLQALRPDIIHETYYSGRTVSYDCPRILTVYDMIHERFHAHFAGPDLQIPRLKAMAVSRADHVITISNSTRDDLMELLHVAPEKITVIPLASSLTKPRPGKGKINDGRPYLLYVGLREGVKNFAALLEAYAHSRTLRSDFDLICVGGGGFSPGERNALGDAGLMEHVRQLEADDTLLAELYSNAALFVYPSLYEGFGLPLLEAMRCGCPVACSNTSSMPEIAGDAALFFDPHAPDEIQSVLESIVLSEYLADTLRMRGYEQERKFSWEKCVRRTAALYRQHVR
ncbi:MAG: glycosyltransferase family 4 protein [Desulfobulbaceae bacterium]|nr:glycosyltransferase family 4 protein [Desulfobulbaceae bacterium]